MQIGQDVLIVLYYPYVCLGPLRSACSCSTVVQDGLLIFILRFFGLALNELFLSEDALKCHSYVKEGRVNIEFHVSFSECIGLDCTSDIYHNRKRQDKVRSFSIRGLQRKPQKPHDLPMFVDPLGAFLF